MLFVIYLAWMSPTYCNSRQNVFDAYVDYYKVSKLAKVAEGEQGNLSAPWELVAPELEVYRERGHRRLAARTYDSKCSSCMWGARMPVEIIVDNWNPRGRKKYRFETFCYGPLSCKLYKAGPNRKVEGRGGIILLVIK
jgi:hypothetical protein